MKKRILAVVAIIALVAILGVVLCACNADSYAKKLEKAGYKVIVADEEDLADMDGKVVWGVSGSKGLDNVTIIKFKTADDAKEYADELPTGKVGGFEMVVEKSGKVVFYGTPDAIKAAK